MLFLQKERSPHIPAYLACDACMAIATQVWNLFKDFFYFGIISYILIPGLVWKVKYTHICVL